MSRASPGEPPLVVLDRDGVINADSDAYIKSAEEWQPLPGSLQAIARLNRAGFQVAVFTNQSGLARGLFDATALEAMHEKMHRLLAAEGGCLAAVFVCPHVPKDDCSCRKPAPGLLQQVSSHFGRSMAGVPVIGDSRRDLEAAQAVGARPILVRTGKGERTLSDGKPAPAEVYRDLAAAAEALISQMRASDERGT